GRSDAARRAQRLGRRLLPRSPDEAATGPRPRGCGGGARTVGGGRRLPGRRGDVPAGRRRRGPPLDRGAALDREGRARAVRTALVTGGASGIGAALVTRLRHEGFDVRSLDLA